jgi:benzoyl-CoA reductase/2-hydroxyglutaryl-CoA dehydratase subunit BcrC/BadD/HgdB
LIGYTCSYIPVELLAATGLKPYRLLHGDIGLSKDGERLLRIDACPLVKSNIAYIIKNQDKFTALVGSTGCDMARRMFDIVDELTDIPVYVLNNPRTDNPKIFNDEIDWLVKELEHLSNRKLNDDLLRLEIERWENVREQYRTLNKKRAANPSQISTSDFHKAAMNYYKGDVDAQINITEKHSVNPRVYLMGSAITYEANQILELLEQELRIVGDFNCGISRFLNIEIKDKNLNGIKHAYYNQPPCIFKRPNHKFYEWTSSQLKKYACDGIIAWTLDYCDSYEFELKRMESRFGFPILRIRSDFSFQNLSQIKTRISAFREMLCS